MPMLASNHCNGTIWSIDDLTPCVRQRYVQNTPLLVSALISALIVSRSIYKSINKRKRQGYIDPARQPLLPDNSRRNLQSDNNDQDELHPDDVFNDQNQNEYIHKIESYGAVQDQMNQHLSAHLDIDPTKIDDPSATIDHSSRVTIATVIRPTSERVRVAVEWIAAAAQLGLAIFAVTTPSINGQFLQKTTTTITLIGFWTYALLLVSIRLAYVNSETSPFGGLWYHSTALYPIAFATSLILFRSALLHPYSDASKMFHIWQFALSTLLFCLNFSSKFGNKPARLYLTKDRHPNNEPISSLFSTLTFSYASPFIWKGYWEPISGEQVWELREDDHAYIALRKFKKYKSLSLTWRIIKQFKGQLFLGWCYAVVFAIAMFGPVIFVKLILNYVEDPTTVPRNVAWLYVAGMLFFGVVKSMTNGQALFIGRRVGLQLRSVLVGEIYAKALRRKLSATSGQLSGGSDSESKKSDEKEKEKEKETDTKQANIGAIINLMSIDAFKVSDVCPGLHYFVSGILQIILSFFLLYGVLGWSAFIGGATLWGFIPVQYWLSRKFAQFQNDLMKVTDQRVEKTNELLQCIRIIKFFAWEHKFADGVNEWREKELAILKKRYMYYALGAAVFFGVPITVTTVSFASYTLLQGETLTSPVAFTSMALFNIMKGPLDQLAFLLTHVLEARVSLLRIAEFLEEDETEKYNQLSHTRGPNCPYIGFENASFSWKKATGSRSGSASTNTPSSSDSEGTLLGSSDTSTSAFNLKDLNIDFPVGKMSLIVGPTGSGKTSMLMALLGEMDLTQGKVFLPGARSREDVKIDPETGYTDTSAYCSQQAWLLNDTLKNNILFASDYDEDRYNEVIEACALKRDLEILDNGDSTEVGEKGVALSGGQKQRISLARAVYSRSRHLILDDCLSAVDSHTALYIYENCLSGPLTEGRTVILVSHNVALTLTNADKVVVIDNGRIKSQGTAAEVVASGAIRSEDLAGSSASQTPSRSNSSIDLTKKNKTKQTKLGTKIAKKLADKAENEAIQKAPPGEPTPQQPSTNKLVHEESMARGVVSTKTYLSFLRVMGNKWFWIISICLFGMQQLTQFGQSWWIREWTVKGMLANIVTGNVHIADMVTSKTGTSLATTALNQLNAIVALYRDSGSSNTQPGSIITETVSTEDFSGKPSHSTKYYLSIYVGIGLVNLLSTSVKEFIVFMGGLRASRTIFDKLLNNVIHARSRFFDSTPVGRIMNRFSKDIEGIDQDMTPILLDFFGCLMTVCATLMLIVIITPKFLIAASIISVFYYYISQIYLSSSRELKRIEAVSRSPIFQHFGETLVGVSTIRAYGDQRRFIRDNMKLMDGNQRPYFYLWLANRWLYFRIDFIGGLVSTCSALFIIMSIGKIDSGLAGMSLSYALTFNEVVLWSVRLAAEVSLQMNAMERIQEYMDIDSEAYEGTIEPPANWPSRGEIEFDNFSMRYAPELPQVIKNISLKVDSFNKIAIVGRTGAGKSSAIGAVFRMVEADSGTIRIDGVDISKVGLTTLRQSLGIIPQDPTLFAGTVRSNLDPFNNYTDDKIFESLRRVHLVSSQELQGEATSVDSDENSNQFLNLNSQVTEGGNNLSQGQRQLMCLARSLLKTPKVLLLDEATASIDYETDSKIQQTIREEFGTSTLLTIAHRLRSIIDYDRVMVMDAGQVVEYDEPHSLLQNPGGLFKDMCVKSGEFEILEQLARDAYKKKHS